MPTPTVPHALALNRCVKHLRYTAGAGLIIRRMPLDRWRWLTFSDAAWANARKDGSQGGWLISLTVPEIVNGEHCTVSVLLWSSKRLPRVTPSSPGAETQALSACLGNLGWLPTLVEDALRGPVHQRLWGEKLPPPIAILRDSYGDKEIATMARHVVDAKSIFDALEKECIGAKGERRTAIELAIVREDLFHGGGRVRWVPHTKMPADMLTKLLKGGGGSVSTILMELMSTGRFRLAPEAVNMGARVADPPRKARTRAAVMQAEQELEETDS
ncbi:hypothetical protein N9L19_01050 [bacterium]|nr:hypothetical protein [bacterium]